MTSEPPSDRKDAPALPQSRRGWVRRFGEWLWSPANAISFVAFAISVGTLAVTEYRRAKDVRYEIISKSYERYYEMNRIQLDKWYLSHLFASPDHYGAVADAVRKALTLQNVDPGKKAEYLIQERAAADFVFTYYEQTRAQWGYTRDQDRWYVSEILKFLHDTMLQNPRLVYWWLKSGGGLQSNYDNVLHDDWNANVLPKLKKETPDWCDPMGPIGGALSARPGQDGRCE